MIRKQPLSDTNYYLFYWKNNARRNLFIGVSLIIFGIFVISALIFDIYNYMIGTFENEASQLKAPHQRVLGFEIITGVFYPIIGSLIILNAQFYKNTISRRYLLSELEARLSRNVTIDDVFGLITNSSKYDDVQLFKTHKIFGNRSLITEFKIINSNLSIFIEPDYFFLRQTRIPRSFYISVGPYNAETRSKVEEIAIKIERVLTNDYSRK